MEILYPRCAGLDVHKDVVVAAVRCVSAPRHSEVRSFATTTSGLLALSEWLASHACTHVAMEATGVYWKPVWHVLEGNFELVLANAQHVRNVPGRKTDVGDAAWIADLLAHGLVRGSFVPPPPIQELRDLTRTRKQLSSAASVVRCRTLRASRSSFVTARTSNRRRRASAMRRFKAGRESFAPLTPRSTCPPDDLEAAALGVGAERVELDLRALVGGADAVVQCNAHDRVSLAGRTCSLIARPLLYT